MSTVTPLLIRETLVTFLRATSGGFLASLPVANVHGEETPDQSPAWPFSRYGLATWDAYEQSCGEGLTGRVTIDVFAEGPGTDKVEAISQAVKVRLKAFETTAFKVIECDHERTLTLRDGPNIGKYHGVIIFRFTAIDS